MRKDLYTRYRHGDGVMVHYHKDLAAGRWAEMPFAEQMANIGSEVERAIRWREKNNPAFADRAFERALELFDLTLDCPSSFSRLKEVARAREAFADFFFGDNVYASTAESWRRYFLAFTYLARAHRV